MSLLRCAACHEVVAISTQLPWRCPNEHGDRHHVLLIEGRGVFDGVPAEVASDPNPFVRFAPRLAWWEFVHAHGWSDEQAIDAVRLTDARVAEVAGTGFRITSLVEAPALAAAVGSSGRVFVKNETGNVAGSHKARHLFSILLHLLASEAMGLAPWRRAADRPALAISSCGNAAIAAAILAASARWPIDVFIPEWAGGVVVDTLNSLSARVTRCPRRESDPPGDPTVLRFREAVAAGSIPFSVQGPENALCLDGGRTIGWEAADQLRQLGVDSLSGAYAQVGGGAFSSSLSRGLGEGGVRAPLVAVQTAGCAPLARAWELARDSSQSFASDWTRYMWPWEHEPVSLADGILDDETYDWVADVEQLAQTHGRVVVCPESDVIEAAELAPRVTGIPASPTGTAGVAGLITESRDHPMTGDVLVVLSGIKRS
jgi:threonine dehydratase